MNPIEYLVSLMQRRARIQAQLKKIELHELPQLPELKDSRAVEELLERASQQSAPSSQELLAH